MIAKERIALFQSELALIRNPNLRSFVEYCLSKLPEYFFHIPASGSGKHHPAYALGEGGLVRHTKAAVRIFHQLTKADIDQWYFDSDVGLITSRQDFSDVCTVALLLHDCLKCGIPQDFHATSPDVPHSVHEHPILAARFIRDRLDEDEGASFALVGSDEYLIILLAINAIASHMGKWTLSKYSSIVLPDPAAGEWSNKMVALCDYLASRKCLDFNFGTVESVHEQ